MVPKIMKKTIRQKVIVAAKPIEIYEAFVNAKKAFCVHRQQGNR